MRQKLMLGAVIVFVLLMAALEHVAGRHPSAEAPGISREAAEDVGVSASPLLVR